MSNNINNVVNSLNNINNRNNSNNNNGSNNNNVNKTDSLIIKQVKRKVKKVKRIIQPTTINPVETELSNLSPPLSNPVNTELSNSSPSLSLNGKVVRKVKKIKRGVKKIIEEDVDEHIPKPIQEQRPVVVTLDGKVVKKITRNVEEQEHIEEEPLISLSLKQTSMDVFKKTVPVNIQYDALNPKETSVDDDIPHKKVVKKKKTSKKTVVSSSTNDLSLDNSSTSLDKSMNSSILSTSDLLSISMKITTKKTTKKKTSTTSTSRNTGSLLDVPIRTINKCSLCRKRIKYEPLKSRDQQLIFCDYICAKLYSLNIGSTKLDEDSYRKAAAQQRLSSDALKIYNLCSKKLFIELPVKDSFYKKIDDKIVKVPISLDLDTADYHQIKKEYVKLLNH